MMEWTDYSDALDRAVAALGDRGRYVLHDCAARRDISTRAALWTPPRDDYPGEMPVSYRNAQPDIELWLYGVVVPDEPNTLAIPEEFLNEDGEPSSLGKHGRARGLQMKTADLDRALGAANSGEARGVSAWIRFDQAIELLEDYLGRGTFEERLRESRDWRLLRLLDAGGIRANGVDDHNKTIDIEPYEWTRPSPLHERLRYVRICRAELEQKLKGLKAPSRTLAQPEKAVGTRGRKAMLDWSTVEGEVFRLMDYHGDFSSDDEEWNAQARLEEAIKEFCGRRFDKYPEESTVRQHVTGFVKKWRSSKKAGI